MNGNPIAALLILLTVTVLPAIAVAFMNIFKPKEQREKEYMNKIEKVMKEDKDAFTRQNYTEAFADNLARMYGYGAPLARFMSKCSKDDADKYISPIKREKQRQKEIVSITIDMIKDSHKTDIHRLRSLIKEYDNDINDPKTPARVKKNLESDKKELEAILDEYLNNKDEFQAKVNNLINDLLQKEDEKKDETKEPESKPAKKK